MCIINLNIKSLAYIIIKDMLTDLDNVFRRRQKSLDKIAHRNKSLCMELQIELDNQRPLVLELICRAQDIL